MTIEKLGIFIMESMECVRVYEVVLSSYADSFFFSGVHEQDFSERFIKVVINVDNCSCVCVCVCVWRKYVQMCVCV